MSWRTWRTSSMPISLTNSPRDWMEAAEGTDDERPRMACRQRRQWPPKALAPRRSSSLEALLPPEREDITSLRRRCSPPLRRSPATTVQVINHNRCQRYIKMNRFIYFFFFFSSARRSVVRDDSNESNQYVINASSQSKSKARFFPQTAGCRLSNCGDASGFSEMMREPPESDGCCVSGRRPHSPSLPFNSDGQ